MAEAAIIARVVATALDVDATAWNTLLAAQSHPTPFMRHEYLAALEESDSATPRTGWAPRFMTLWEGEELIAACPLYLKNHSYGEYSELCSIFTHVQIMNLEVATHDRGVRQPSIRQDHLDTYKCDHPNPHATAWAGASLAHRDRHRSVGLREK